MIGQSRLAILPVLLVIVEGDHSSPVLSGDLAPAEDGSIRLAIERQTLGVILLSVGWACVPAVHLILALEVALAVLIGALLTCTEASEGPVDGKSAIEAGSAIGVAIAVLILVEPKALAFFAFLRDALVVRPTVSPRVEKL